MLTTNISEPSKLLESIVITISNEVVQLKNKNARISNYAENLDEDTELLLFRIDNLEKIDLELQLELSKQDVDDRSELEKSHNAIKAEKQKLLNQLSNAQTTIAESANEWESEKEKLVEHLLKVNTDIQKYFDKANILLDKNIIKLSSISDKIIIKSIDDSEKINVLDKLLADVGDKSPDDLYFQGEEGEKSEEESENEENESENESEEEITMHFGNESESGNESNDDNESNDGSVSNDESDNGSGSESDDGNKNNEEMFYGKIEDNSSDSDNESASDNEYKELFENED